MMIKKIKERLISVLVYAVAVTCFLFCAIVLLMVGIFHTGALFEKLVKFTCKAVIFCAGIRVTLKGTENVDPGKQYIIMMNHVNLFDGFLCYGQFPGKARAVEEESHFNWFIYGWVVRRIGLIPINRKSGRKALAALKKAADLIRERKEFSLAILPEGTRTRTGKLGNFKKGGFLIAIESGLDILPMIQIGSYKIKQKGNWLIRPGKIELLIEKPISTKGYSKENINELMQKTRDLYLKYVD